MFDSKEHSQSQQGQQMLLKEDLGKEEMSHFPKLYGHHVLFSPFLVIIYPVFLEGEHFQSLRMNGNRSENVCCPLRRWNYPHNRLNAVPTG